MERNLIRERPFSGPPRLVCQLAVVLMLASAGCSAPVPGEKLAAQVSGMQVNVLTWHNDNALTGLNPNEAILTPANVNANDFGQLFSYAVDGYVYAQPLYLTALSIPDQGTRNVVFAATQHDSIYAFDADGLPPGILWQRSFIDPNAGIATVPTADVISRDIVPEVGITGSPVIDGTTGILYVVPKTKEMVQGVAHYIQRLHAVDVATGLDVLPPVVIGDTTFVSGVYTNVTPIFACGRGDGSEPSAECPDGRVVRFNALRQLNRSALTLSGDRLYIAWASHGDNRPYHGWIAAFDKTTLELQASFNTSPNGRWGGIWQSGAGLAVDSQANLYFSTGNGTFSRDATDVCQFVPSPCDPAYGDSVVKVTSDLTVADYFTPNNQAALESVDQDLGSGGTMLLPDQPGAHPHLMVETGKQGRIYLIDRDDMGGYRRCGLFCDDVVQIVNNGITGVHSTPAFFDNRVYYQGSGDVLKAFRVVDGLLQTPPDQSNTRFGFPGATASISALGTANAIAWTLQTDAYGSRGAAILHAYEAVNLPNEFYNSGQTGLRDQAGGAAKFTIPTIANGKVYVGTATHLNVFGLFPPNNTPPNGDPSDLSGVSPTFSQVTLSWANHATNATGIKIERSTDGKSFVQVNTVPRDASTYTDNGLRGSTAYFYRVRATNQVGDSEYSNVAVANTRVQPPTLTADTCVGLVSLAWNATADGHYDIERSPDGISFTTIRSVDASTTSFQDIGLALGTYVYRVEAFAVGGDSSLSNSLTITLGPILIDHSLGFDSHAELNENGSARFTSEGVASLNNLSNQTGTFFTTQRVGVRRFSTSFGIRLHEGTDPRADGLTFTIQGVNPTALGPAGGGLGYGPDRIPETPGQGLATERGIRNSVAIKFDLHDNSGEGPNSTGIFTDGRSPTIRAPELSPEIPDRSVDLRGTGIDLQSQSVKKVDLTYDGTTLTETITDLEDPTLVFTTSYLVDIPSFVGADTAFVGFTGATGSQWSIQDILTWSYQEDKGEDLSPRQPANLRVTSVDRYDADHSNITLSWLCNAYTAITGFSIERSSDRVDFTEVGRVDLPGTTFIDQALAGGVYYYRARADNDASTSVPSSVDSVIIGGGDQATVVDHSAGFADHGDLTANGNATYVSGSARITTSPAHGAAGSFFLNNRVPIKTFAATFKFLINPAVADGMTFALQGNSPTALGLRADGLGFEQMRDSVAIKFQIFDNGGSGPNATGIFTDGRHPSVRPAGLADDIPDVSIDLRPTPIDLHSLHVFNVDITYDGAALNVTITDTVTLGSASQTYLVDLPRFVGGNFAYIGFTGGTGGFSATQDVQSLFFQAP